MELTPLVMMSLILLHILTASILTFLLSVVLLWRYRRKVTLTMATTGGFETTSSDGSKESSSQAAVTTDHKKHNRCEAEDLFLQAMHAIKQNAVHYGVSGLLFAFVFALAAHFVFPFGLKLPGFFVGVWFYAWPIFLAFPFIVPASKQQWMLFIIAYVLVLVLLGVWAATVKNLPELRLGAFSLPARSSVTPQVMAQFWLKVNAAPTLLAGFCFNSRIRAVAPLVLAFVVVLIAGLLAVWFGLFSKAGIDTVVVLSESWDLHPVWFLLAAFLLSLIGFGASGWLAIRWIGKAYRHKWLSDQSLRLDALWLLFGGYYGMWLSVGGAVWIATLPAAFLVYRTVLEIMARACGSTAAEGSGLIFLRVFSLGRRSDQLLDTVAGYWRYLGSIQMITGPDVARSTVQPHQFLDFLSGKLGHHFVSDHHSLTRRLLDLDLIPDPDRRYRINNFFCHEDSWKPALLTLVKKGDTVLMDLRSFSSANDGCIHELQLLIREVPMDRCLFVVDNKTDDIFLRDILVKSLETLPPGAPNCGRKPEEMTVVRFSAGTAPVRGLIHQLCQATGRLGAYIE